MNLSSGGAAGMELFSGMAVERTSVEGEEEEDEGVGSSCCC